MQTGEHIQSARSFWEEVCFALQEAYGENTAMSNFKQWLSLKLLSAPRPQQDTACHLVLKLVQKSFAQGDDPPAWFMGAVKKPPKEGGFGYRPTGRRKAPRMVEPANRQRGP